MNTCTHATQHFDYRVRTVAGLEKFVDVRMRCAAPQEDGFEPRTPHGAWHELGSLREVLRDVDSWIEVSKWVVPVKPYYTVKNRKKILVTHEERTTRQLRSPACWLSGEPRAALAVVAEACGLKFRDTRRAEHKWQPLAPNAVLHPQFGPGVTIATDGVWVVLWDCPWPGGCWEMVHRSNLVGPVTTTPTAAREWAGAADWDEGTIGKRNAATKRKAIFDLL